MPCMFLGLAAQPYQHTPHPKHLPTSDICFPLSLQHPGGVSFSERPHSPTPSVWRAATPLYLISFALSHWLDLEGIQKNKKRGGGGESGKGQIVNLLATYTTTHFPKQTNKQNKTNKTKNKKMPFNPFPSLFPPFFCSRPCRVNGAVCTRYDTIDTNYPSINHRTKILKPPSEVPVGSRRFPSLSHLPLPTYLPTYLSTFHVAVAVTVACKGKDGSARLFSVRGCAVLGWAVWGCYRFNWILWWEFFFFLFFLFLFCSCSFIFFFLAGMAGMIKRGGEGRGGERRGCWV